MDVSDTAITALLIAATVVSLGLVVWSIAYAYRRRNAQRKRWAVVCLGLVLAALINPLLSVNAEGWYLEMRAVQMHELAGAPLDEFVHEFGEPDGSIGMNSGGESISYTSPWIFLYRAQEVIVHLGPDNQVGYAIVGG